MEKERNYGIDLLKIIATLMMVIIHTQGNGGILFSGALTYTQETFLDSDDFWQGSHILSDLQQIIFRDNPDVIFNYMSSVYPDYIDISEESGDFVKNFPILC